MMTYPPAITRPGDLWYINEHDLTEVMARQPGVTVGRFETIRDAACAVQAHNAWEEIVAAWDTMDRSSHPKEDAETQFFGDVIAVLQKHGRA